ncbi:MAG: hypothetical protein ACFCUH_06630 [Flavobacteriales bacterium]
MFKIFEYIIEAIGWLQIVASPLLIGLGIGAFIYFPNPTSTRLAIGISVATIGLIIGILLATKIWKTKEGTIWFLSRIMATPELDKKKAETNDNKADSNKGSL